MRPSACSYAEAPHDHIVRDTDLYPYEGKYPENTPCSSSHGLIHSTGGDVNGRTLTLKYFYADGCG